MFVIWMNDTWCYSIMYSAEWISPFGIIYFTPFFFRWKTRDYAYSKRNFRNNWPTNDKKLQISNQTNDCIFVQSVHPYDQVFTFFSLFIFLFCFYFCQFFHLFRSNTHIAWELRIEFWFYEKKLLFHNMITCGQHEMDKADARPQLRIEKMACTDTHSHSWTD